jgi:branched-chain amino acid transport system ATP-binding protein
MASLSIRNLTKVFGGVRAIDQVDMEFEMGKITALIGPNGSGKTTLINATTGILPIDGGSVIIGNSQVYTHMRLWDIAALGIARTFQNARLIGQMSVLDNLLLVLTERNVWSALFERHGKYHLDQAEDLLKKIGLWDKRHANAGDLSYGQRKLLEIARAVGMRSKVYFFDEPFAGLFVEMRKTVSGILCELKAAGATVVLVEHDMALVRELADICYVLDSGKVIARGSPEQVLSKENVIEAYLGK